MLRNSFCRRALSEITQPHWRTKFPTPEVRPEETAFLQSIKDLKNTSIETLKKGNISVVKFSNPIHSFLTNPDLLFVRSFYPDLLQDLRKRHRSILMGNPGVGKSFFQFYYLLRIFNPTLFGDLPADSYGSVAPPKIVVRQISGESIEVYEQSSAQVFEIPDTSEIFKYLSPQNSLYLMEPGVTIKKGPFLTSLPTLLTVSVKSLQRIRKKWWDEILHAVLHQRRAAEHR
jgi:hypothetical protein